MKQTLRHDTFETNSSSYHTITIRKKKDNAPKDNIVKGIPTKLTGKINYKTIGYTSSYQYTSVNSLDKANMLLRYIASEIEYTWIYDQKEYNKLCDNFRYGTPEYREKYIGIIENYPPLKVLLKVISDFTGEDTVIEYKEHGAPYIDSVCDDNQRLDELLDLNGTEMEDEDLLYAAIKWIVFNNDVEIIEECESNE